MYNYPVRRKEERSDRKEEKEKEGKEVMSKATVRREKVQIPTYRIAEPEKSPVFLEKRAYQGSTGKVYPLPVTEKIRPSYWFPFGRLLRGEFAYFRYRDLAPTGLSLQARGKAFVPVIAFVRVL